MRFFIEFKASWLYGKAYKKYINKNYLGALALLEKVKNLDPQEMNKWAYLKTFGLCHFKNREYTQAIFFFKESYDLMEKIDDFDDQERESFNELTQFYIRALRLVGKKDNADKIEEEAKKMLSK